MNELKDYITNLAAVAQRKEQERGIGVTKQKKQPTTNVNAYEVVNQVNDVVSSMPKEAKLIINTYVKRLMILKPSIKAQFKTDEELIEFKREFAYQCFKHAINSKEKLDIGMKYVEEYDKEWIDISQFIRWCKEGYNQELHQRQLLENTARIMEERKRIGSTTFEDQQRIASKNISQLREILAKK